MKNKIIGCLMLLLISLSGCASLEHNQSILEAISKDGSVKMISKKNAYTATIFPAPEKATDMSKAYSGAANTNYRYNLQTRNEPSQQSSYLPSEKDQGDVLFQMSGTETRQKELLVLLQNHPDYSVKILDGPFASETALMPGDGIEATEPLSPGQLRLHYEYTNLDTGNVGRKSIALKIAPGQKELYISEKQAKKDGLI